MKAPDLVVQLNRYADDSQLPTPLREVLAVAAERLETSRDDDDRAHPPELRAALRSTLRFLCFDDPGDDEIGDGSQHLWWELRGRGLV